MQLCKAAQKGTRRWTELLAQQNGLLFSLLLPQG